MRIVLLILFLSIGLFSQLKGQEANKKGLYNKYSKTTGDPGRTIKKSDSSFVSIMPVTYTKTTLQLKRFGRLIESTTDTRQNVVNLKIQGKWKVVGDTLKTYLGPTEGIYLIDRSMKGHIFLQSLTSNRVVFRNEE